MVKREKLDWLSNPRPMALVQKGSFAQTRFKGACLLNAWKGGEDSQSQAFTG